ncbi:hypothetical protein [Kamptonema formosum]|uniref:hypothetical protein n=1 Tax=Kamptonema formosum TaxID=331992 RepID=UPI000380B4A4|nr:hypothetical protein [Kamptonema formosum]
MLPLGNPLESIAELGYFLKPSELFSSLAKRALGNQADKDEISDEELEKEFNFYFRGFDGCFKQH